MSEVDKFRSDLKPYWRARDKKWYGRGKVPIKTTDGNVTRERREIVLRVKTKKEAEYECDRLNEQYKKEAQQEIVYKTFAKAAANYIELGGDEDSITDLMIEEIGTMECRHINDSVMVDLVNERWPKKKPSNKTVNRWIYTPIIAVLNIACKDEKWVPNITRPKGIKKKVIPKPPANQEWFTQFLIHCKRPQLRALVLLMTLHGRRLSDPLNCSPSDFDVNNGTLIIGKDKNGDPLQLPLVTPAYKAIVSIPDWDKQKYLFGYGPKGSSNVRRDIKKVCEKADIKYYPPHHLGRHAFAKRLLDAGHSLQVVKEAGHWKNIEIVSDIYGHLEQTDVDKTVKKLGGEWGEQYIGDYKDGGNNE